ncbi:MAG: glycosyltransferase, partial [Planctomycetes bacterium]|nr:glycosyltransferase [Planctomycetota bacterium]
MRILQIIAGLDIGGAHGGAERCGLELARSLAHQHSVEVCAFWQCATPTEQEWAARLRAAGIPLFFATPQGSVRRPAAYLPGLRCILQRYPTGTGSFDIAHSHFQLGSLAALLLRRKQAARRVVRTAHVTLEWGPGLPNFLYRWFFNGWLFPLLLDAEAGVSQAVVDQLRRHPGVSLAHRRPRLVYNANPQENVKFTVLPSFVEQ